MARDFSAVNLAIWQDPEWRDLPSDAKLLYLTLWTHPQLNRAGVVDWRPGRIAALIDKTWTPEDVRAVADCLEARLFIVTDDQTEECLIRSWVRFDGLLKSPIMSVTFANDYAATHSTEIQAVVVHELKRLKERETGLAAWTKSRVLEVLEMPSIDPRHRDLPADPLTHSLTHALTHSLTPALTHTGTVNQGVGVNPSSNPSPTPSPSPTPLTPSPNNSASTDVEREFEDWYSRYPRKRGKGQALKAYKAARKKVEAADLIKALQEQSSALTAKGPEYTPYPATWLNGERWEDDVESSSAPKRLTDAERDRMMNPWKYA